MGKLAIAFRFALFYVLFSRPIFLTILLTFGWRWCIVLSTWMLIRQDAHIEAEDDTTTLSYCRWIFIPVLVLLYLYASLSGSNRASSNTIARRPEICCVLRK